MGRHLCESWWNTVGLCSKINSGSFPLFRDPEPLLETRVYLIHTKVDTISTNSLSLPPISVYMDGLGGVIVRDFATSESEFHSIVPNSPRLANFEVPLRGSYPLDLQILRENPLTPNASPPLYIPRKTFQ